MTRKYVRADELRSYMQHVNAGYFSLVASSHDPRVGANNQAAIVRLAQGWSHFMAKYQPPAPPDYCSAEAYAAMDVVLGFVGGYLVRQRLAKCFSDEFWWHQTRFWEAQLLAMRQLIANKGVSPLPYSSRINENPSRAGTWLDQFVAPAVKYADEVLRETKETMDAVREISAEVGKGLPKVFNVFDYVPWIAGAALVIGAVMLIREVRVFMPNRPQRRQLVRLSA